MLNDRFDVDLTKLANSVEELIRYRKQLQANSENFVQLGNSIRENWTSDSGEDLNSINRSLDECIRCIDGTVIPVLNETINIMIALGNGTNNIASSNVG